jgi:hypothetical protein
LGARPTKCHENAAYYATHDSRYRPVGGWLIVTNWMVIAHSVIHDPSCGLVDITPKDWIPPQPRPKPPWHPLRFLPNKGSDEEYLAVRSRHPTYTYSS